MTDIQAARDTLARWGKGTMSPLPWKLNDECGVVDADDDSIVGLSSREVASFAYLQDADAALIVAMCHPDLRAALDGILARASHSPRPTIFHMEAERLAAAILKIDKEMTA